MGRNLVAAIVVSGCISPPTAEPGESRASLRERCEGIAYGNAVTIYLIAAPLFFAGWDVYEKELKKCMDGIRRPKQEELETPELETQ